MKFDHRTRRAREATTATAADAQAPGKRTLTEELPVQRRGARGKPLTGAAAGNRPSALARSDDARPTLQMLRFGAIAAAGTMNNALALGKCTLTEQLPVQRRDASTVSSAERPRAQPVAGSPIPGPSGIDRDRCRSLFGPPSSVYGEDYAPVHAAAARGVATPASPLPYLETIQRCFGRHDVSGIQAHVGAAAAASARAIDATAYATGHHVVFDGEPDLHTAAHEAAHVVQQRAGVPLNDGINEASDDHERHADAVADTVVRGGSAEALLDALVGVGSAGATAAPVQRRKRKRDPWAAAAGAAAGGGAAAVGAAAAPTPPVVPPTLPPIPLAPPLAYGQGEATSNDTRSGDAIRDDITSEDDASAGGLGETEVTLFDGQQNELAVHVLSFLPPRDLLSCLLVSRTMNELATDVLVRLPPVLGGLPPPGARTRILAHGPPQLLFLREDDQRYRTNELGYEALFDRSSLALPSQRYVTAKALLQACGIVAPERLLLIVDVLTDARVFANMCNIVPDIRLVVSGHGFMGKSGQALWRRIQSDGESNRTRCALVGDHELFQEPGEHGIHLHMKSAVFWTQDRTWSVWGSSNWTHFAFNRNAEFWIVQGDRAATAELVALSEYFEFLCQASEIPSWLRDPRTTEFLGALASARTRPSAQAYNQELDTLLNTGAVTPKGNKKKWLSHLHVAYKVVHAEVVSEDTMVFFSFPSQTRSLSGKNSVAENVVRVLNAALASAADTIAMSSMTLFDAKRDWIFEKLLELLQARPGLVLQLLVDSQDGSWQRLQSLFSNKLGPDAVVVFAENAALTRVSGSHGTTHRSCRVQIYGVGRHEGGASEWLFHTKVLVVDRTFAIFTTANYRAAGYGGLSAVNKYCLTRNPAWIDQTIRYLNAYFWWARTLFDVNDDAAEAQDLPTKRSRPQDKDAEARTRGVRDSEEPARDNDDGGEGGEAG